MMHLDLMERISLKRQAVDILVKLGVEDIRFDEKTGRLSLSVTDTKENRQLIPCNYCAIRGDLYITGEVAFLKIISQ